MNETSEAKHINVNLYANGGHLPFDPIFFPVFDFKVFFNKNGETSNGYLMSYICSS